MGVIVSTSDDKTLRVWNATTREVMGLLPLPGALHSLGLHPWAPQMVCGDTGGVVYQLELVGFEHGLIVVTAWRFHGAYFSGNQHPWLSVAPIATHGQKLPDLPYTVKFPVLTVARPSNSIPSPLKVIGSQLQKPGRIENNP